MAALAGWGHDLPAATRAFCIFAGHKAVVNDFDLTWTVYSESLSDVVALADALDAYARPAQERAA